MQKISLPMVLELVEAQEWGPSAPRIPPSEAKDRLAEVTAAKAVAMALTPGIDPIKVRWLLVFACCKVVIVLIRGQRQAGRGDAAKAVAMALYTRHRPHQGALLAIACYNGFTAFEEGARRD